MDSANQDPERSQKTKLATIHKKRLLVFALLALTVITTVLIATVITAAAWFIRWLENGWSETRFWELTAYLATTVGAAGTIFSAIAVLCAIYSVHLQSKELALQRAEMARSREELAKSAVAQLQSSNAMLSHAQIGALRSLAEHERHLHTTARKESEKHRAGGREKAYETLLESTYTIMSSPTTQNPTLKSAIHRQALCFGAVMSAAVEFESLNQTTKNKTGNQKALADGANHCLALASELERYLPSSPITNACMNLAIEIAAEIVDELASDNPSFSESEYVERSWWCCQLMLKVQHALNTPATYTDFKVDVEWDGKPKSWRVKKIIEFPDFPEYWPRNSP